MDAGTPLKAGDVIQINPDNDLDICYSVALAIVEEPEVFGAQVYIVVPQKRGEAPALVFLRAKWQDMELIGEAPFAFFHAEVGEAPPKPPENGPANAV